LSLQRQAGNQATVLALQRDPESETATEEADTEDAVEAEVDADFPDEQPVADPAQQHPFAGAGGSPTEEPAPDAQTS
jgi:hypothetical protein